MRGGGERVNVRWLIRYLCGWIIWERSLKESKRIKEKKIVRVDG